MNRVDFFGLLPGVFRPADGGNDVIGPFLHAFEDVYEQLRAQIAAVPDLLDPTLTPPAALTHADGDAFAFLQYLADWIGIRLRPEKSVAWNRELFARTVAVAPDRGTLTGLDTLLRAWLRDDIPADLPLVITDLTRRHNDVDTVFQLGESILGVSTVLGEGPAHFFVVDLVADPSVRVLHNPVGLDVLQRVSRLLLDDEKPAHTNYQLRIRGTTMQLAPPALADARPGETYAQLEDGPELGTALLWSDPWVFESSTT
ncbi:hypothetical protein Ait01nite_082070 [Actinoplanes italicus]|uniref:Phage tail-like protein n=1 Tax=Actinoplanes italicus TaxID=113567 RepID=A0A2T0K3T0_9ACTN|nr:hypothetical protein [Actinoplanes italicus]PRX17280.1 phage tail-like protein [Actinoplanes italicus]GIE35162.1 hypothetical protein Ait01nite_082070 [Actinoplanes italicus]